jgi:hypothetical protein
MYLPGPPQRDWTRIFSESRFVYFSVIETDTATKGRCLPWSKEEEGAYIFWMEQVPVIKGYVK